MVYAALNKTFLKILWFGIRISMATYVTCHRALSCRSLQILKWIDNTYAGCFREVYTHPLPKVPDNSFYDSRKFKNSK